MSQIKNGACTVVKGIAFHFEGEIGHAPKYVANAFVDVWKKTLVKDFYQGSRILTHELCQIMYTLPSKNGLW